MDNYVSQLNALQESADALNRQMRALYMQRMFLSWRWWLCAALTVVPWVVWILIRRRESTARLLFSGFVTVIIAMLLDDVGVELNLWDYHVDIDAINPSFLLWDMTMLPIATMVLLQFRPSDHPLLKAAILGGMASFVMEPLFARMNFYDPEQWKYIYSFPIYVCIFLIAHLCWTRKSFEPVRRTEG